MTDTKIDITEGHEDPAIKVLREVRDVLLRKGKPHCGAEKCVCRGACEAVDDYRGDIEEVLLKKIEELSK